MLKPTAGSVMGHFDGFIGAFGWLMSAFVHEVPNWRRAGIVAFGQTPVIQAP